MNNLSLVLILTCIISCVFATSGNPPECRRFNCPQNSVLMTTVDPTTNATIQLRYYEPARWVRTNISSISYEEAGNEGFYKLFDYISGANEEGIKIDMTAPVSTQIFPGAGPFCKSNFIVSFYVPEEYQYPNPAPPTPTEEDVWVEMLPATIKAVYLFDGYATVEKNIVTPITQLDKFVIENNLKFIPNVETVAQYDSPYHFIDRHNEIWIDVWGVEDLLSKF